MPESEVTYKHSDSCFAVVCRLHNFLDIVDPAWAADALSDDELEIPAALDALPDDGELDAGACGARCVR
jgi:hypothetical protein